LLSNNNRVDKGVIAILKKQGHRVHTLLYDIDLNLIPLFDDAADETYSDFEKQIYMNGVRDAFNTVKHRLLTENTPAENQYLAQEQGEGSNV
jgi:hypothetical protein